MSINSYTVFESKNGIVLVATVDELFINGDIVSVATCNFFSKDGNEIGYARVTDRGQYHIVNGDYNGKNLINAFQFVA